MSPIPAKIEKVTLWRGLFYFIQTTGRDPQPPEEKGAGCEVTKPESKEAFDREYEEFLLSEVLCQAMKETNISVRKLAEQAKVSTGFIQGIRSGKAKNITLGKLSPVLDSTLKFLLAEEGTAALEVLPDSAFLERGPLGLPS